jgi:arylsulfatase A-like enzyme
MMEIFAGYGAHVDYEMGRVIEAVKKLPDADNTIVGDNGSSPQDACVREHNVESVRDSLAWHPRFDPGLQRFDKLLV